jgi:hypothetical protein
LIVWWVLVDCLVGAGLVGAGWLFGGCWWFGGCWFGGCWLIWFGLVGVLRLRLGAVIVVLVAPYLLPLPAPAQIH